MIDAGSGAVGDGKVACVVRRRVGKGIQGACAPMAERCGWRFAAPWCCGSSEQSEISEHSDGLADARSFSRCGRCVSSVGLMAAICLPGEVRRPVPGCYLPGGALGVLSVGADASLRAAHCFSIAWMVSNSDSWICASQHSSSGNRLH